MGHHIDDEGRFQSDKHPELPPDRIRVSFAKPQSWPALALLAYCYEGIDAQLSQDILDRLDVIAALMDPSEIPDELSAENRAEHEGMVRAAGLGMGAAALEETFAVRLASAVYHLVTRHGAGLVDLLDMVKQAMREGVGHIQVRETWSAERATAEKGYPHPGNVLAMPDEGGEVYLQYGHPDEVGRNGCFTTDVLAALIDNLEVYQQDGHPLACTETERTLDALRIAKGCILDRKYDRQDRNVHETDKP